MLVVVFILASCLAVSQARHLHPVHHAASNSQQHAAALEEIVDGQPVPVDDVTKLYPFFGEIVALNTNTFGCGSAYYGKLANGKHYIITAGHCILGAFSTDPVDTEIAGEIAILKRAIKPYAVDFGRRTKDEPLNHGIGRVALVSAFVPKVFYTTYLAKVAAKSVQDEIQTKANSLAMSTQQANQWANWKTNLPKHPSESQDFANKLLQAYLRKMVDSITAKLEPEVEEKSSEYYESLDVALVELASVPPQVWVKGPEDLLIPHLESIQPLPITSKNSLNTNVNLRLVGFGQTCANPDGCDGPLCELASSEVIKHTNSKVGANIDATVHRFEFEKGPCPASGDSGTPVLIATNKGFEQIALVKGGPKTHDGWKHHRTGKATSLLRGSPASNWITDVEFYAIANRH